MFGFIPDEYLCPGESAEEGREHAAEQQQQATEDEPVGLIPPGGKTLVVVMCEAKYVAGNFGVNLLLGHLYTCLFSFVNGTSGLMLTKKSSIGSNKF